MEGDKKRKRAASDLGRPPTLDSCSDSRSESTPHLDADVAPGPAPRSEVSRKNAHEARGRPKGGHPHLRSQEDNAANRERMRANRARSADQVRLVVSAALDFPRIPVSSSATSLIHV